MLNNAIASSTLRLIGAACLCPARWERPSDTRAQLLLRKASRSPAKYLAKTRKVLVIGATELLLQVAAYMHTYRWRNHTFAGRMSREEVEGIWRDED